MDRYYMPVSREEDDSIDHQYKVYDYSTNDYQRTTKALPSKMKTKYWLGKQQLRQKMGKEQDEWVVRGDSSLDARLSYFHHVNHSCNELLRLCDRMQHHMKGLSVQGMLLGKFLDARSKHEGTEAGKMMSYIGYAEEYMSKKRNTIHPSLNRLMTDLGVFQQKAVQDCSITVNRMETFRTEFRASLLWLENISQQLNPEDRDQLDKFRKVQSLTREKRVEFARMKDNTIQKIEILAASRINLLSARLEEYHLATQRYLQSSINALKEVVAAKERLDAKIEEKRIADLEAEIDAHNPSKKSCKLISSSSQDNEKEEEGQEEDTASPKNKEPMKLKDHVQQHNFSDDEELVNLQDDFGEFEAAALAHAAGIHEPLEQAETLDDIFGRLSPACSMPEDPDLDLLGGDAVPAPPAPTAGEQGGMVGDPDAPSSTQYWFSEFSQEAQSSNPYEGKFDGLFTEGEHEALDWTMMNDLLTEQDADILSAPPTQQDIQQLSDALTNLDTGINDPAQEEGATTDEAAAEQQGPSSDSPRPSNKQPMQPQQFNAWLNLFSELDPIAQSKSSGNLA